MELTAEYNEYIHMIKIKNIIDTWCYYQEDRDKFTNLVNSLVKDEQLIDINPHYIKPIELILKEKMKAKKIKQYQIGNWGDYGYCVFINRANIIIPVKDMSTFCLAC